MERCTECHWLYPVELLNALNINGKNTPLMCGICALDLTNQLHGLRRSQFRGEVAEGLRKRAVQWRKENFQQAPPLTEGGGL